MCRLCWLVLLALQLPATCQDLFLTAPLYKVKPSEGLQTNALAEHGCKFDEEYQKPPVATVDDSQTEGEAKYIKMAADEGHQGRSVAADLGPDEYWSAENALGRCRSAGTERMVKVAVGAPVVILAGSQALTFIVNKGAYGSIFKGVYAAMTKCTTTFCRIYELGCIRPKASFVGKYIVKPAFTAFTQGTTAAFQPMFQFAFSANMAQTMYALTGLAGTTGAVYFIGGMHLAIPGVAIGSAPIIAAMKGAHKVTDLTVEIGFRLLGYGGKYPSCCCAPAGGKAASPETCALVASSASANWDLCPKGWTHDATQCAVPEVISYQNQTVEGCQCKNETDCGSNLPYKGHAWCEVEDAAAGRWKTCGWKFTLQRSRRWDHCRVDGKPLNFHTDISSAPNDALATFIPNRFGMALLLPSPHMAFSLGTWVEPSRGLTTARPTILATSKCFAGTPVETLSGCAQLCLKEGAPTAKSMSDDTDTTTYPCVAFAYHRQLHLCVRLPEFATDAEFTPHLSEWTGDGWMNFVSKYHGRAAGTLISSRSVCPANTLLDIRESGYDIVRDKNNGHIYIQCANTDSVQKVSCLADDCEYKSSWCFVKNSCRSGVPAMFGGCTRLADAEALSCAGKHGAIIPDNGKDHSADLEDAADALGRCWKASAVRMIKVAAAAPLLLAIGQWASVALVEEGLYAQTVGSVFEATYVNIAQTAYRIGDPVGTTNKAINIGKALVVPLLQLVWAGVAGSFLSLYTLGSSLIAITPTAAAVLTPLVTAFAGVQMVSEATIEILSKLVGYGGQYPKCCCPDEASAFSGTNKTRACAVMASRSGGAVTCPDGWSHDATQCSIPEVVRYSEEQTVAGCQCAKWTDCSTNPPHHGHAWCHVSKKNNKCGHKSTGGEPWDFCRLDGKPLEYASGVSSASSDALATFIPNEYSRISLLGPGNPFKLWTWTDAERGVTTGKAKFFGTRECFVSTPVETLGACAKSCLEEGAPSAKTMSYEAGTTSFPCVAFAYHREQNMCVRLPAFATDSKYTPMLRRWGGEGWQNFVSKYYARNLESSCPALTLLDIRDKGYAVARDKNNGHLYLRCAGQLGGKSQKASCIPSECSGSGKDASWCFVENKCGWFGNTCKWLERKNPLTCDILV